MEAIAELDGPAREEAIVQSILEGNIPDFLRQLVPVKVLSTNPKSPVESVTFWVMPDYLAIGSNSDYVRIPMNLYSAERISQAFNFRLPTRKMVDDIYRNAKIKLRPQPMRPGPQMTSTDYFSRHHALIEKELGHFASNNGQLIAGHKKDLVQSMRLLRRPGTIAIYGWHRPGGRPIQPLSTVHVADYADYSHGIRLVANEIDINYRSKGPQPLALDEALADNKLSHWLSDEGRLYRTQILREINRSRKAGRSS